MGLGGWELVLVLSGIALAGVGVYVARVGRGEHANGAFGLYAVGFGLTAALDNAVNSTTLPVPPVVDLASDLVECALLLLALGSLVVFTSSFPRPLAASERRFAWWAAATFAVCSLALVPYAILEWSVTEPGRWVGARAADVVSSLAFDLLRLALLCASLVFALRFRAMRNDPSDEAQRIALVAAALTIYPLGFASWDTVDELARGEIVSSLNFLVLLPLLGLLTAIWLASTRSPHHHAAARNVAIVGWLAALVGMLFRALDAPTSPSGLMRIIEILLIAYAVVRYQLLGIDVKIRWGISKGTVGAVFIAVFFIASELAQQVLGNVANSQFLGIVAAGGLVFALAPLQRAADRIAMTAVPVAAVAAPAPAAASATAIYRQQVELAWTDGTISPNERVMLRGLRKHLGIDADAADEIEHEVETARMRDGV